MSPRFLLFIGLCRPLAPGAYSVFNEVHFKNKDGYIMADKVREIEKKADYWLLFAVKHR